MLNILKLETIRNGKLASKVLYGAITALAVLVSLEDSSQPAWKHALILVISVLGVTAAKLYSQYIGMKIDRGRSLDIKETIELWNEVSAVFISIQLPIAFLVASGLGLMDLNTAMALSRYSLLLVLFLFGFFSRHLSQGTLWESLCVGVVATGFGLMVTWIKLLAH